MTASGAADDRVLFDVDYDRRIATIMLNNPKQRNSYDATMRDAVARCLDRVAEDDDLTVVLLRGAGGVFSAGADMNNAYGWYGDSGAKGRAANAPLPTIPTIPVIRRPGAAPVSVVDLQWTANHLASTTT